MLAKSDTNISQFIPSFAKTGVPVAFLVPTETGYQKSIMDATAPIRNLLKSSNLHDYDLQGKGTHNKVLIKTFFVHTNTLQETETSLYRPETKDGDPRLWIYKLKEYCQPYNLLALICIEKQIYVFNLSNPLIAYSLLNENYCYEILKEAQNKDSQIVHELLNKLRVIHNLGFLPSITPGDPGVGDTLENALGIKRNNIQAPDYKGIELKTTRLTRQGSKRQTTRYTLFTKVPDEGMTYREILDNFGKIQTPRNSTVPRKQLEDTLRCSRPNAYGLLLAIDAIKDKLVLFKEDRIRIYASAWNLENLKNTLKTKHPKTFWIKATSELRDNREFFRYDHVTYTNNPNISLLPSLFESDIITVDLAIHYKPNGQCRDHGVLFKILPDNLKLLMGEPQEFDL